MFWPEILFTFWTWEAFPLVCGMGTVCRTSLYFQMYFCLLEWHWHYNIADYPVRAFSACNYFFSPRIHSYSDLEKNGLLVIPGVFLLFATYVGWFFSGDLVRSNIISTQGFLNNFILSNHLLNYWFWDVIKWKAWGNGGVAFNLRQLSMIQMNGRFAYPSFSTYAIIYLWFVFWQLKAELCKIRLIKLFHFSGDFILFQT